MGVSGYTDCMVLTWMSLLLSLSGGTSLAECKRLDEAFDTKAMVAPCTTASKDTAAPIAERVEALRLLATAEVTNGEEAAAQAAFFDMLRLAPGSTVPADASPRVRTVFDNAKRQLQVDGAVSAVLSPVIPSELSGPMNVEVTMNDALKRVSNVRIELVAGEQKGAVVLAQKSTTPAGAVYAGVIEPVAGASDVTWKVVATGPDGANVAFTPALEGGYTQVDGFPLVPLLGGIAGVVVVGAAVTGLVVYLQSTAGTQVVIEQRRPVPAT
jgi:hypothetical protein